MKDLIIIDYVVISIFSACCLVLMYNFSKMIWYVIGSRRK